MTQTTIRYKNIGGPWRSSTGEVIPRDGILTPTSGDLHTIDVRRLLGIRFVVYEEPVMQVEVTTRVQIASAQQSDAGEDAEGDGGDRADASAPPAAPKPLEQWPLRMQPALYLRMHPTGPHAALAQAHVDAVDKAK